MGGLIVAPVTGGPAVDARTTKLTGSVTCCVLDVRSSMRCSMRRAAVLPRAEPSWRTVVNGTKASAAGLSSNPTTETAAGRVRSTWSGSSASRIWRV